MQIFKFIYNSKLPLQEPQFQQRQFLFSPAPEIQRSRQRHGASGEISLFAGLIKCGECGKALTVRMTNDKHPRRIYSCKTYNAYGKQHCTQHRIEYDTLYSLVLNKIRECAKAALTDGEAIAGRLSDTCNAEHRSQREALERTLSKDGERTEVLEKMVLRLYEDMVAGRISEANFSLMLEKTQKEQAALAEKMAETKRTLDNERQIAVDARQWVEAIQEYADITELDAATLNRLIKEIRAAARQKAVLFLLIGDNTVSALPFFENRNTHPFLPQSTETFGLPGYFRQHTEHFFNVSLDIL